MVVGCAGVRPEASEEEQGHTEVTKEQARSDRCASQRTVKEHPPHRLVTNDVPGCPKGGLLSGTSGQDFLHGEQGDDEVRGFGDKDGLNGGYGADVIYGGPGADHMDGEEGDDVLYGGDGGDKFIGGGAGEDVFYGGKGNDWLTADDRIAKDREPPLRDELYCGPGKDHYHTDRLDYVDSSCEEKVGVFFGGTL
jgi:hypothetical protein